MRRTLAIVVIMLAGAGCRSQPTGGASLHDDEQLPVTPPVEPPTVVTPPPSMTEPAQIVEALRGYCKACHAIGDLKFITSEADDQLWERLFTDVVPGTDRLWALAMVRVLKWPGTLPPDQEAEALPGIRWMPLGAARFKLAQAKINDSPARAALLLRLNQELVIRGITAP